MHALGEQVNRAALLALTLSACNPWVRGNPGRPMLRENDQQRAGTVRIESYCDPFDDGTMGKYKVGSGVMVSDWQVLTVIHVVDCRSAIPTIHVTNRNGESWKFLPEKEWEMTVGGKRDGVARLQMASGSSLEPRLPPPALKPYPVNVDDSLFLEVAEPQFVEQIVEGQGDELDVPGGKILTYTGWTEEGNSGGPLFDTNGDLAGLHMGVLNPQDEPRIKHGVIVTPEMIPH